MKYKILLAVVVIISVVLYQGFTICDRVHPLNKTNIPSEISDFESYKHVKIKLRSCSFLRFTDKKILIIVNTNKIVFWGTYQELLNRKISLPQPDCNENQYYIAVAVYDFDKQIVYSWSSDTCNTLDEEKTNQINLRYTGSPEESITLDVTQI